jgi:signal transduction histidine kinase
MPRGGTLIVRARREERGRDQLACVDVIDTGHGIDESARSRVFEPFFTTKTTGTGLGLPLVKRVIDAHGGELSFVSSNTGTTFTVGMPIS